MTDATADSGVRAILEEWAAATRQGRKNDVLKHHAESLVIFDVLPPMKYVGAEAYKRSWDDWQPETQGEAVFDLEDLTITARDDLAFAYGFIRCGGRLADGRRFEDLVRATFCLNKVDGAWRVQHQHVSKPYAR
jgi:ketosteroid isomerase-like protein